MATLSLAANNQTEAAALLAKRAMAGRKLRMTKTAAGGDPVGAAFKWLGENPSVAYPLAGAAGGAAAGGLLDMGREEENRTPLASMATGALAGGGLGLGAGLLKTSPATSKYFERGTGEPWSKRVTDYVSGLYDSATAPSAASPTPGKPSTATPGKPPTATPAPTPTPLTNAQLESAVVAAGVKRKLFTADEYANADEAGQAGLLKKVQKAFGQTGWGGPAAQAAVSNIPEATATGLGVGATRFWGNNPMPTAGNLTAGMDNPASLTAFPQGSPFREAFAGMTDSQRAAAARAGSGWNYRNFFSGKKPAYTIPGKPAVAGVPMGAGTAATAATNVPGSALRSLLRLGKQPSPGAPVRAVGRLGGASGVMQKGLVATMIGKWVWDARNLHSTESAQKAYKAYSGLGFGTEQIAAELGPEAMALITGAK